MVVAECGLLERIGEGCFKYRRKGKKKIYDKCIRRKDRNMKVPSKRLWVLTWLRGTLRRLSFSFWLITQNRSISVTWFSVTTADVFDPLDIRLKLLSNLFHSFISSSPLNVPFRPIKRVSNLSFVFITSSDFPRTFLFTCSMSCSCCFMTLPYRRLLRIVVLQRGQDFSWISWRSSESSFVVSMCLRSNRITLLINSIVWIVNWFEFKSITIWGIYWYITGKRNIKQRIMNHFNKIL